MKTSKLLFLLPYLLGSIILLIIPAGLFGQESLNTEPDAQQYFLGVKLGVNDFHAKDNYISPDIYHGKLFSADISFRAQSKKFTHEAELFYSIGKPALAEESPNINQNIASLSYTLFYNVKMLKINGSPLRLELGTGLSSFVMNSDFILNGMYGLGKYTDQAWYWSHSLNLFTRGEYSISEDQEALIQIGMPILRLVSRPVNGHWMSGKNQEVLLNSFFNAATGGKMEFFTERLVINCYLRYTYKLNNGLNICGSYGFNFISSNDPLPMKSYMNVFLIGLDVKL